LLYLTFTKMDNAFIIGHSVWGEHYAPRELMTETLVNQLTALKNIILTSPPGWGKRSMALHTGELLSDKDYTIRTSYIDLHRINSIEEFCQSYAQVFSFDLEMFTIDPNSLRDHLDEVLAIPEYIAVRDRVKHIIFIGQIEQIAGFENSWQFQQKLRTTWKLQSHCAYFLYGNDLTTKKLLLNSSHNPFKRIGRCFKLPRIHHQEFTEFIQRRFQQTGKQIGEREAASIASRGDCIPFYVQLLGWHVWMKTENTCTQEIVSQSMEQLILQYDVYYQTLTNALNQNQIRYLYAHLRGDQKLCSGYSLQEFKLKTSGHVSRIRTSLINKEILGTEIGGPFLLDPIYQYWLNHRYFGIP
jgi:hypothetical protein